VELMADPEARRPFPPSAGVQNYLIGRAQEHGLILRAIMDVIAFCPPLIIDAAGLDELFARFDAALAETTDWVRANGLDKPA
jgi:4-aminobutyrate--pyruvate transaminase